MMRNVNQVCGVVALIAVGCLVAFGSAGDRIVSAAPGQIEPAGDTGQAIAIGGCNRCAWEFRRFQFQNVGQVHDEYLVPQGTSGSVMSFTVSGAAVSYLNSFDPSADSSEIFPTSSSNGWPSGDFVRDRMPEGMRFHDGVRFQIQGNAEIYIAFRLD
jgi:hypothetical protein